MAFPTRKDFCGLASVSSLSSAIRCNGGDEDISVTPYEPTGQKGDIVAIETYGENATVSNSYDIKTDLDVDDGDIKLNSVVAITEGTGNGAVTKKYALESFTISTSNNGTPTLSAQGKQVESGADNATQCLVSVPAFEVSKKHHAQILFAAFDMGTTGCDLIECSATVGGQIDVDVGEEGILGSDIKAAKITVQGKILKHGSANPVVTVASGWKITKPLSLSSPAGQYEEYSFTVEKKLAKDEESSASSGTPSSGT